MANPNPYKLKPHIGPGRPKKADNPTREGVLRELWFVARTAKQAALKVQACKALLEELPRASMEQLDSFFMSLPQPIIQPQLVHVVQETTVESDSDSNSDSNSGSEPDEELP